jgi:hypothetical protein
MRKRRNCPPVGTPRLSIGRPADQNVRRPDDCRDCRRHEGRGSQDAVAPLKTQRWMMPSGDHPGEHFASMTQYVASAVVGGGACWWSSLPRCHAPFCDALLRRRLSHGQCLDHGNERSQPRRARRRPRGRSKSSIYRNAVYAGFSVVSVLYVLRCDTPGDQHAPHARLLYDK